MAAIFPSDDLETIPFCELCHSSAISPNRSCREPDDAAIIAEMRGTRIFPILQCDRCGLAFVSPRYNREKLLCLYGDDYFNGSDNSSAQARIRFWNRKKRIIGYRTEVALFKKFLPQGKVFDAGCGPGWFADALGNDYTVTGGDWSKRGIVLAREESACREVYRLDIERDNLGTACYDGAVMIQVLDHLRHPVAALKNVARALRPKGILLISGLPNFASPLGRIFGDDFQLLSPNHLYYFTPATVRKALHSAGLTCVTIRYPFFTTPYFTQSWLLQAPLALAQRLCGRRSTSPPGPGNVMSIVAIKH